MLNRIRRRRRRFMSIAEPAAPVNVTPPVATGVGYVGYTLATTNGTWTGSPSPTFAYQWQRSGVDIGGATASTYPITLADEGLPIRCVVTATNASGAADANSNAIEQWVPADAGAPPQNWFDAWDLSTITLATGVSAWANKGSLGGSVAQANAANQPMFTPASGIEPPRITFDGIDDNLDATGSNNSARNVNGATVASVALTTRVTGLAQWVFTATTPNNSNTRVGTRTSPAVVQTSGRRLDANTISIIGLPAPPIDVPCVFQSIFNYGSAQAFGRVNGVETSPAAFITAGFTSNTASARRRIGAAPNGTQLWSGRISEIVQYAFMLDATNRDKLDGYLAWRWRAVDQLDVGSPYKTAPPGL